MTQEVIDFLVCPYCGGDFEFTEAGSGEVSRARGGARSLRCSAGHTYDIARQGYVNLLAGTAHKGTADTAEMIAAREAFLRSGHYKGIAQEVAAMARQAMGSTTVGHIVDVGAGTGYYLAAVLDSLPESIGLALDLSTFAARRAARAHPRMGAAVCDAWATLPVRTGSAQLVLSVFAPRNPREFRRILAADGALVVVVPTGRHLQELVSRLGLLSVDERKEERLEAKLAGFFTRSDMVMIEERRLLSREEVDTAVGMGPSARHVDPATLAGRVAQVPEPVDVTLSVAVMLYR